jgi:transposase
VFDTVLGMEAYSDVSVDPLCPASPGAKPFDLQTVTLSRREHVDLVAQVNFWKALHSQAKARIEQRAAPLRRELAAAKARVARLEHELEHVKGLNRDLRRRLFSTRSERGKAVSPPVESSDPVATKQPPRPRGQQPGTSGHGRTRARKLRAQIEVCPLAVDACPNCGSPLRSFPGTQDSEVLEIEVSAHRRIIRRQRAKPTCGCRSLPGIVTAPAPARLIPHGKLGVSIWVEAILSKFGAGQPSHRLLAAWEHLGLHVSQGTLTDGLKRLAPLFDVPARACFEQLRRAEHWHADETRWPVFEAQPDKVGHRCYLWVFRSVAAVCFVVDPSRSAAVPEQALAGVSDGILSVDRYSAYHKFARQHDGIQLAICWAHQRRDFLTVANRHPQLWPWAMDWLDRISMLYRLHGERRQALFAGDGAGLRQADDELRIWFSDTERQAAQALAAETLDAPALKVLRTLTRYWPGLKLYLEHPWLDLDNNAAERAIRPAVVCRKNFYGSGAMWSAKLAADVLTLLATLDAWQVNPRIWLTEYLQACAALGGQAPDDLTSFLPWAMAPSRLQVLRHSQTTPSS